MQNTLKYVEVGNVLIIYLNNRLEFEIIYIIVCLVERTDRGNYLSALRK